MRRLLQSEAAAELKEKLPNDMQREMGGSSWLSTLPSIASYSIRALFVMLSAAGIHQVCPFNAPVESSSQLNTL